MRNTSQPDRVLYRNTPSTSQRRKFGAQRAPLNAKQKLGYINAIYGTLDGLSTSYSILRCYFDALSANTKLSSPDLLHDWLMTHQGRIITVTESVIIISLSYIANTPDENDKNKTKQFIVQYWPYLRDAFKSIKNSNRSVRGTLQLIDKLFDKDILKYALPIGLGLGVVAIVNRCVIRYTRAERNNRLKDNIKLLLLIKNSSVLNAIQCKPKSENKHLSRCALVAAFYSGLVDGIYLHMGVISLATLSPSLFIMAFSLSAGFSLLCIITRLYEIYNEQQDLRITQEQIKLTICGKELQAIILELLDNAQYRSNDAETQLIIAFDQKLTLLEERRAYLQSLVTLSYAAAFLAGIRGGLAAYGALESLLFAISTITTLMFITFPPMLIMVGIVAGIACLLGFSTCSVLLQYFHRQTLDKKMIKPNERICVFLGNLKLNLNEGKALTQYHVKSKQEICEMITESMTIAPSAQISFQEGFEIFRSFFSGIGKGQKAIDFTLYSLQQVDKEGHYHDTSLMFVVMAYCSLIYALIFAKRASAAYERAVNLKKKILQQSEVTPSSVNHPGEEEHHPLSVNSPARLSTPIPQRANLISNLRSLLKSSSAFFSGQQKMPPPCTTHHDLKL